MAGAVVRPFVAPAHEYGPGHRGVDLAAAPGAVVVSPAAGTVTFAGPVAGRGVVVVEHAGGTLTSLEPVTATVARGTAVAAGEPVAVVAAAPRTPAAPTACVHWGVRVGGRYVDPWWWLGRGRAVRLLPPGGLRGTPAGAGGSEPRPGDPGGRRARRPAGPAGPR